MLRDTRSFFWEPETAAPPAPHTPSVFQPDDNVAPISAGYLGEPGGRGRRRRRERGSVELLKILALLAAPVAWNFVTPVLACWGSIVGLGGLLAWLRWRRVRIFGPVCYYDLVRTGRRSRFALLRASYLVWLLVTLATVYAGIFLAAGGEGNIWLQQEATLSIRGAADFAESYFYNFALAQFLAVVVLTPVYVASALPEEKERGTAEGLFTTHLEDQEILLGKMVSRMGHLLYLVLAGLPFIAVLQFFGGVAPALVIASFTLTIVTLISLGSLSMWCGVRSQRVADAIFGTYLWAAVYLVTSLAVAGVALFLKSAIVSLFPATAPTAVLDTATSLGNPIWAIVMFRDALFLGVSVDAAVFQILSDYVAWHLIFTVFLLSRSVQLCRKAILVPDAPKPLWRRTGIDFPPRLVRPPLGRWPALLWKEIHAEAPIGSHRLGAGLMFFFRVFGWFLVACLMVYVAFGIGLMDESGAFGSTSDHIRSGVRALGSLLGGSMALLVPIYAAGAIVRERERQTLDGLLTLPVTPTEILFAKWAGATLALRPIWNCLLVIWAIGLVTGSLHILALPCLVIAWWVYAATGSALGLWFSLRCRSSLRAMVWAVATVLGLIFTRNFVLSEKTLLLRSWLAPETADDVSRWLKYGLVPWDGLAVLSFGYGPWGGVSGQAWDRFRAVGDGLVVCLVVCGILWLLNRWRWSRETSPAVAHQ